ncbi:MAG: hypothetical protein J7K15_14910, partial [Deltaproteobacteria bacterium]|nr:hypothetical protein [Deltaproteobacteria bacterium]
KTAKKTLICSSYLLYVPYLLWEGLSLIFRFKKEVKEDYRNDVSVKLKSKNNYLRVFIKTFKCKKFIIYSTIKSLRSLIYGKKRSCKDI